jgi:enoyl reductase-like protein
MSLTEDEGNLTTPREFDYWKLTYRELSLSPDWAELTPADRAQKFLERVEEQLHAADAPPQRKALFNCAPEERVKTARRMIEYFESEDRS